MPLILWIREDYAFYDDLGKALEQAKRKGGILLLFEGEPFIIRIEKLKDYHRSNSAMTPIELRVDSATVQGEGIAEEATAIVFDQMFRGFADVIARELPEGVEIHEILGKGLESPVKIGRITRWPAHDDYDVMKTVEKLAGTGRRVILVTGDKRLARQVASLGNPLIRVEYMPPNEFPGKESIIRKIIELVSKSK